MNNIGSPLMKTRKASKRSECAFGKYLHYKQKRLKLLGQYGRRNLMQTMQGKKYDPFNDYRHYDDATKRHLSTNLNWGNQPLFNELIPKVTRPNQRFINDQEVRPKSGLYSKSPTSHQMQIKKTFIAI